MAHTHPEKHYQAFLSYIVSLQGFNIAFATRLTRHFLLQDQCYRGYFLLRHFLDFLNVLYYHLRPISDLLHLYFTIYIALLHA